MIRQILDRLLGQQWGEWTRRQRAEAKKAGGHVLCPQSEEQRWEPSGAVSIVGTRRPDQKHRLSRRQQLDLVTSWLWKGRAHRHLQVCSWAPPDGADAAIPSILPMGPWSPIFLAPRDWLPGVRKPAEEELRGLLFPKVAGGCSSPQGSELGFLRPPLLQKKSRAWGLEPAQDHL